MDQASKIRSLICPKDQWVDDKELSKCKNCERSFVPIFVWKHHCRFCGGVFCADCVSNIMTGQSIGYSTEKRLRYCDACRIRIEMMKKDERNSLRKFSESSNNQTNISMIEIDEPDIQVTNFNEKRITQENIRKSVIQERINLQSLAISLLRQLAHELCEKYGLETATWEVRLTEIAWKAVVQTKPKIFLRKAPFNLLQQIRVLTIIAPNQAVAAVCVKGLVLEKTLPSKLLETHMKFPRIVTVRPSIEADSLMKSKQVRFDQIVLNEDKYLKGYMQSLFRLNPTIIFVENNVSKGAMEIALERNIMIIPKVKNQDLLKIERLALIRRRIDNLLFIDKNYIADIIGCCERVYFKSIRQGSTLLFIEHQAGIRTVLLGDTCSASNQNLKKVFHTLLKAAWNLKSERELVSQDIRLCPDQNNQSRLLAAKTFFLEKYVTSASFLLTQETSIFKMRYCQAKIQSLSRPFQEYCRLRGRKGMLDPCGDICWHVTEIYAGQELSLGTFLLKCSAESAVGCQRCDGQHLHRFYIDNYVITVSFQTLAASRKLMKLVTNIGEQEQRQKSLGHKDFSRETSQLYSTLTKFIHAWREEQSERHPKLLFSMFFRCEDCSKILGNSNQKSRIGNDLLIMSLHHFLYVIIQAYITNQKSEKELLIEDENSCRHESISRVFQCPRALIKFSISKIQRSQILSIALNESMMKRVVKKDASMVSQLFLMMILKKRSYIESIEKEMEGLPFSGGMTGMASSISIAGNSALEHSYFWPYMKVGEGLTDLKDTICQIEENIGKYVQEGSKDWTILMRKFSKIDHVIKASREIILFIINALKKQKIQENIRQISCSIQDNFSLINFATEEKIQTSPHLRKFSQHRNQGPLIKSQSINPSSPYSTFSVSRLRKQTSVSSQTEFDDLLKRMRKERYLRFQGAYLYYPIGNIEDAVSLLACCLNSDEFKQNLKEGNYRDYITTKIIFNKEVQTDWPPTPAILQIYKELIKEEFYSGQTQEVEFSIYYHKQFEELRVSEKIDFKLYVRSLYGCQNWDSSGGKSNSSFSKAHNEILVVKIINEKQFVQFQKFAPAYLKYMKNKRENKEESYLAKIFGIYEVIIKNKVYMCVVMQNIFFGLDLVENVYDLKGSEVNRLAVPAGEKSFTRLDTNFLIDRDSIPYLLEPSVYDKTVFALTEDANFLKEQGVIDYSLLAIESGTNLRMGIIDFMRPYHFVEKIQTFYKEIKSGKDPTVIPPQQYAERFVRAMRRYFAKSRRLETSF